MRALTQAGLKTLRQLNNLYKAPRKRRAARAFEALRLGPDDLAIDCGANVGDITARLARDGARVHAFEPSPIAFEALTRRVGQIANVSLHNSAVSDHNGTAKLYLHRKLDRDPLGHSAGSSLIAGKHNLDADNSVEVTAIDLAEFIAGLGERVRLLKIDVEGLEAVLINHLIDRKVIERIDQVYCETHEFKVPGLAADCRALRKRLSREGIGHVNLDWA